MQNVPLFGKELEECDRIAWIYGSWERGDGEIQLIEQTSSG